ncbi:MAG: alpha-ketoglutarate-dependent dioxygenase AlkB [Thermosynechococcaceae cyanobacterium]
MVQQLALIEALDVPLVEYWPCFLSPVEANHLMLQSLALDWHQHQFPRFGKVIPLPRLESFYGDSTDMVYVYSGVVELRAQSWPPFLAALRDRLEAATGYSYQVAMGNLYRNGQDSMGYHADDEPTLGQRPAIASVSLGATRKFRLKCKETGRSQGFVLSHGDLVLMLPGCQEGWVHGIPKTMKCRDVRINWTFRPYVHELNL